MTLARKTPAASVRWLSLVELKASHLATAALDAIAPILITGANGLNAKAFDGDPPRADLVQMSVAEPVAGRGATLEITFRYRRGGGAVEAEATARPSETPPAADPPFPDFNLTLRGAGAEPLQLRTAGMTAPRAVMPRERFCALARSGATVAASGPDQSQPLPPVELSSMEGAKALIAEACP
jgi:hypothetical protein